MLYKSFRSRPRLTAQQPIEPFSDFVVAQLSRNAGDNPALGVEERRGWHGFTQAHLEQVVASGASPDGKGNFVLFNEFRNAAAGFCVIERSGHKYDAPAFVSPFGRRQQRQFRLARAALGRPEIEYDNVPS